MAEIYLARAVGVEGFEKLLVVKRILSQYTEEDEFVTMFQDEARFGRISECRRCWCRASSSCRRAGCRCSRP